MPLSVLHDQEALLTRLLLNHQEGKRTVFLVGSPLTAPWEDGGPAFPEILWAFYSSDDGAIRSTHANLLEGLRPGIERGRVDCYGGIDSNRFFPALAERLRSETPSALSKPAPKAATAAWRRYVGER